MRLISKSLSKPGLFKISDEHTHKVHCGCSQEWYRDEWQRRSGCGPSTVCNIISYLNETRFSSGLKQYCSNIEDSLSLMEEIWEHITPTAEGIPTTKMLYDAVIAYAKLKDLNIEYSSCDIPEDRFKRPDLASVVHFLERALVKDVPIAFLNLCNGEEKNLEPWHWVTITSLESAENESSAFIGILDGGLVKTIDLSLWYNTTTLGGGFVYFIITPSYK